MTEEIPLEIEVCVVRDLLESDMGGVLIDCRETHEYEFCRIDGAISIPMQETPSRVDEFADHRDTLIIVLCHHGMRSLTVVQWLRRNGFSTVQSMAGGIDAWSIQIDSTIPRY